MFKFQGYSINTEVAAADLSRLSRKEWLELRQNSLGGSDIAAALGLSRWKSPQELWLEKIGQPLPKEPSENLHWGLVLEEPIRQELSRRTGWDIEKPNAMFRHPQIPYLTANLDGLAAVPGQGPVVVEIKTTGFKGPEWEDGQLPAEYALQMQMYLSIMDLPLGMVGCLIAGQKLVTIEVARDEELVAQIQALTASFWRYVETRTPPPIDGSASTAELLARLYPTSRSEPVMILPEEVDLWLADYWSARTAEEQTAENRRLVENRIKLLLGDHERGVTPAGTRISWKAVTASRIDVSALKTAEPATYAKFSQTSSSRRFQVAS